MKVQFNKFSPELALRLGLGLTFIYAATQGLLDPQAWVGFVPHWVGALMPISSFLTIHSIFELLLGIAILVGLWLPASSLIAFADILAILVFYGVDDLTFRDFGLMLSALALFLLTTKK